jgi:uncharacterized protein
MPVSILLTGLIIGAAGSMHCIGMCGPISFALPIQHFSFYKKIIPLLFYQIGRIVTYGTFGLLFGLLGRKIYLAGFQQWYSIAAGVLMAVIAIVYFLGKKYQRSSFIPVKLFKKVQQWIIKILSSPKKWYSYLLLGMANGLLPCGMVYVALASSLSLSTCWQSASFMAAFGAGTLPAMIAIGLLGQQIKPSVRITFNKMIPGFILLLGVMLVLRGMNLGIPFISPSLPVAPSEATACHT